MEKYEKRFKISSVIDNLNDAGLTDGESERSEITPVGTFTVDGDKFKLEYTEQTDGGKVEGEITVAPEMITVIRRGAVVSEMHFAEGKSHRSLYSVPPFSFDTEVVTKRIRSTLTAEGGRVDIFYNMNIGGQDKRVRMRIECS